MAVANITAMIMYLCVVAMIAIAHLVVVAGTSRTEKMVRPLMPSGPQLPNHDQLRS